MLLSLIGGSANSGFESAIMYRVIQILRLEKFDIFCCALLGHVYYFCAGRLGKHRGHLYLVKLTGSNLIVTYSIIPPKNMGDKQIFKYNWRKGRMRG